MLTKIADLIRSCRSCPLHKTRTHAVPGYGSAEAEIFILGEAPGENEDEQGLPFVGRSGERLDAALESVGIDRYNDAFTTNVVKCRPPDNSDPQAAETEACKRFLIWQLRVIKPRLVITVGRFALHFFAPQRTAITKAQGKLIRLPAYSVYPLLHPSATFRRTAWHESFAEAVKRIPNVLEELEISKGEAKPVEQPKML